MGFDHRAAVKVSFVEFAGHFRFWEFRSWVISHYGMLWGRIHRQMHHFLLHWRNTSRIEWWYIMSVKFCEHVLFPVSPVQSSTGILGFHWFSLRRAETSPRKAKHMSSPDGGFMERMESPKPGPSKWPLPFGYLHPPRQLNLPKDLGTKWIAWTILRPLATSSTSYL